jgi:hypothetical protein
MKPAGYENCYQAIMAAKLPQPKQYEPFTQHFDTNKLEEIKSTYGADLYAVCLNEVTAAIEAHEDKPRTKYYEIDEKAARLSHEMMSMRDYPENRATREYQAAVDAAAEMVEVRKKTLSPFYHDKLDALLDRYARRLAEWTNAYNRNGASCPSVLVSGGSNFPVRKKEKQNARESALWQEYEEIKGLLDKIRSVGNGAVDLADPHAREMLQDQLQKLQAQLDTGKAMNAYYRKHNTMKGFPDLSDEDAAKMDTSISSAYSFAQKPMPDYELTSIRGKIKRLQARLEELDKLQSNDVPEGWTFEGGEVVINAELNRLQIIFDYRPDDDTRTALKSNGFRWAPSQGAWQRQLTDNAIYAAKKLLNNTTEV